MTKPIVDNNNNFYPTSLGSTPKSSSLNRKITELFFKVTCNLWRTLASYFQTVKYGKYDQINQYGAAVKQLKYKAQVGPSTVKDVTDTMMQNDNANFISVNNFMFKDSGDTLPKNEKNKLIFIPVVIKGIFIDHIVAVVYDPVANVVELFDPKGLTAKDRTEYVRCSKKLTLQDVLTLVKKEYGNTETKLWENTKKHQYDSHNCGIYVLDYIERRATGETVKEIANKPLTFSEANNSKRAHYLDILLNASSLNHANDESDYRPINRDGDDF